MRISELCSYQILQIVDVATLYFQCISVNSIKRTYMISAVNWSLFHVHGQHKSIKCDMNYNITIILLILCYFGT